MGAAIFTFHDDSSVAQCYVVQLTAIDGDGNRFRQNQWRFEKVQGDLQLYLESEGFSQLDHPRITVPQTSPADLLRMCKTNPRNGMMYGLLCDNCQRWVRVLLVDGYGVDPDKLPVRAGQYAEVVSRTAIGLGGMTAGAGCVVGAVALLFTVPVTGSAAAAAAPLWTTAQQLGASILGSVG